MQFLKITNNQNDLVHFSKVWYSFDCQSICGQHFSDQVAHLESVWKQAIGIHCGRWVISHVVAELARRPLAVLALENETHCRISTCDVWRLPDAPRQLI